MKEMFFYQLHAVSRMLQGSVSRRESLVLTSLLPLFPRIREAVLSGGT